MAEWLQTVFISMPCNREQSCERQTSARVGPVFRVNLSLHTYLSSDRFGRLAAMNGVIHTGATWCLLLGLLYQNLQQFIRKQVQLTMHAQPPRLESVAEAVDGCCLRQPVHAAIGLYFE